MKKFVRLFRRERIEEQGRRTEKEQRTKAAVGQTDWRKS